MKNLLLVSSAAFLLSVGAGATTKLPPASRLDANKKLVVDFYETAFNKREPEEAMEKYVGEKYIQHNPFVADGKNPFLAYFVPFFQKNPQARSEIKRVIAEGDLVVLHVHSKTNARDPGRAIVDIFRVENGKIAEHWDVAQPVHDKPANSNGMF